MGSSNGGDVRASNEVSGNKDVVLRAKTLSATASNTKVSRGDQDRGSVKTELHPLVALAGEGLGGVANFVITVRDGDTVISLVFATFSVVRTVRGVKGVKESINSSDKVLVIINNTDLVVGGSLGVYDRDSNIVVEISFFTVFSGVLAVARSSPGCGSLGNKRGVLRIELVQIALGVLFTGNLEDTKVVGWVAEGALGEVVQSADTLWSNDAGAVGGNTRLMVGERVEDRLGEVSTSSLAVRSQLCAGADEVIVISDIARNLVLIGTNIGTLVALSAVLVVLCVKRLQLGSSSFEFDPSLVVGDVDGVLRKSSSDQPSLDRLNRLSLRSKGKNNLLGV